VIDIHPDDFDMIVRLHNDRQEPTPAAIAANAEWRRLVALTHAPVRSPASVAVLTADQLDSLYNPAVPT
jgi:aminoglycoside phosphotransferase (APT) family kinase protein